MKEDRALRVHVTTLWPAVGSAGGGAGGSRIDSGYGRHGLDAGLGRAGAVHDAGAGALLRRDDAQKNMLSTIMHSFFIIGLVSVQWVVIGYTLAFGTDIGRLIGGFDYLFLNGVGQGPSPFAKTIPDLPFMMYQGMFAVITPALIIGAFAERMRFGPFVVFTLLWATLVYDPIAHWVWGGGWLGAGHLGALDFAGGTVVHISSGIAALAAALVLGRRLGWPREPMLPHNLPFTVLGAGMLWFGWFGFNAGSALAANGLAASAFVATHIWRRRRRPWPGRWRNTSSAARRACSVRRRDRWPDWWRSRRRPASSARCRP